MVTMAPRCSTPCSALISASPLTRWSAITWPGLISPRRIIGTSAVPPAMSLASPSVLPRASTASATVSGWISSKGRRRMAPSPCPLPLGGGEGFGIVGGGEHRLDDLDVAGAAAQVPGERLADLVGARRAIHGQQRPGREDHAGCAEAALGGAQPREGVLERIERVALQPLDGHEGAPGEPRRQHQAGADRLAVEQHGAGTAHALAASVLGAGEREAVAQEVEHGPVGRRLAPARPAVERELEGEAHARPRSLPRTRSAVIGSSVTRSPIAEDTAFMTAAGVGVMAGSPIPLAPNGPSPFPDSSRMASIAGTSRVVGIL